MNDDKRRQTVNRSGFPLQIAVANLVQTSKRCQDWHVLYQEHAWEHDGPTKNGFIDLVLEHRTGALCLVIECKRVLETSWIFFNDNGSIEQTEIINGWISDFRFDGVDCFKWTNFIVKPPSPQSSFCVIQGSGQKPILEQIAAEVVFSVEALAEEEASILSRPTVMRVYICAIITTATLFVGEFCPDRICLDKGEIQNANFEEAPFVRFRKQVSNKAAKGAKIPMLSVLGDVKERCVFVINAARFADFISTFECRKDDIEDAINYSF